MTKYEFGVMSKKWSLEAEDMITAYITMSLFIKKNIPIAVYKPTRNSFMPKNILEDNKNTFNPEKIKECTETIKEMI